MTMCRAVLSNEIMNSQSQTVVAEIFKSFKTDLKSARDTVNAGDKLWQSYHIKNSAYWKWIDGIHSMLSVSRIYSKDKKKELQF
jgi:hypothetical protein